jgi:hypothetical protein
MALRCDRWLRIPTLATLLLAGATARAGDETSGVWWENTFQMQMQGMSMPAQVSKACLAKNGSPEPPRSGDDSDCTYSDVKHEGARTTWKVVCTGKHPMTGEGEMTGTREAYSGKMTMHMAEGGKGGGDMAMVISGKRLGGDCDANATKKQVAALKKQSDEQQALGRKQMAEQCEKSAAEGQILMFGGGATGFCKDQPGARTKLREVLGTLRGFVSYQQQAKADPSVNAIYQDVMGSDPEADRAKHCKKAAAESKCEKTPGGTVKFIRDSCPAEMQEMAKQCCSGRDYSGVNEQWNRICTDYAKNALGKGGARDEPKPDAKPDAKPAEDAKTPQDQAKKLLKGLFGK